MCWTREDKVAMGTNEREMIRVLSRRLGQPPEGLRSYDGKKHHE
jgi:hypothetical protein